MKVSIIVPAYNEEDNLPVLIKKLDELNLKLKNIEIILVDDNSTDSTPKVCDLLAKKYQNIRVLHRKNKRGMGNALKDGTKIASGEIIVWVMADLSDDISVIPLFIEKIEHGADMVFGSRYMRGGSAGDLSRLKKFVSSGFTFLSRLFIGVKVHDITNAFRAFKKEIFNEVEPRSSDFAISPEFALKVHLAGYKLDEVPTVYTSRKKGKATFSLLKMSFRYASVFVMAFFLRLKRLFHL